MASASYQRLIEPLNLTGANHVIAERWRHWKRSFQFYVDGQAITDAKRQHSQLLHYAGPAVQDIFETLQEPHPAIENRYA